MEEEKREEYKVEWLLLQDIEIKSDINPRKRGIKEGLDELVDSIEKEGLRQPVVVRNHPSSNEYKYEMVSGQRRGLAFEELGKKKIPAYVEDLKDDEAIRISFTTGSDKVKDLPIKDKGEAVYRIRQHGNRSWEEVAEYLSVAEPTVKGWAALHILPDEAIERIDAGQLSQADGRAIAANTMATYDKNEGEMMNRRAKFMAGRDKSSREKIRDTMKRRPHSSIEDIKEEFEEKPREISEEVTLTEDTWDAVKEIAEEEGVRGGPEEQLVYVIKQFLKTRE